MLYTLLVSGRKMQGSLNLSFDTSSQPGTFAIIIGVLPG